MVAWTDDNMVIKFEGGNLGAPVFVEANWKIVEIEGGVEAIDTTRGPNRQFYNRVPGMNDRAMKMTLGIDTENILPTHLRPNQTYTISVMPQGNVAGKPMHKQKYFYTKLPLVVETGRSERVYQAEWTCTDDPIVDYFTGGVVP